MRQAHTGSPALQGGVAWGQHPVFAPKSPFSCASNACCHCKCCTMAAVANDVREWFPQVVPVLKEATNAFNHLLKDLVHTLKKEGKSCCGSGRGMVVEKGFNSTVLQSR